MGDECSKINQQLRAVRKNESCKQEKLNYDKMKVECKQEVTEELNDIRVNTQQGKV